MSVCTLAAYLGFHLGRGGVVLAGDVGFLLGLGLHLLFLGAVRGHLLEHNAPGENVFAVHIIIFRGVKETGVFASLRSVDECPFAASRLS